MAIARRRILGADVSPWVHCTSRCVRRAYLCGGKAGCWEHRRAWVEDRLEFLARCFAVEVAGYAVMSNHFHVITRMRPELCASWNALEVTRRWLSVYPRQYLADGTPALPSEADITLEAQNEALVTLRRTRLADLGWLMKALKEGIAKRANREDGCSGTFWEGRFRSTPLLDQAALVAAMAYVDLNPVRAKVAVSPETSHHTGVERRIRARQHLAAAQEVASEAPAQAAELRRAGGLRGEATHAEDGLWLCPLARCLVDEWERPLSVDEYLTLVDATGRLLRAGKRGSIEPSLAPILSRLEFETAAWVATMRDSGLFRSTSALGQAAARMAEAGRRGLGWIRNRCPLFARKANAA